MMKSTEKTSRKKYHVKKGDQVVIISGNWKAAEGKITAVISKNDRVVVEVDRGKLSPQKQQKLESRVRTVRKSRQNPQGGLIERPVSVHVSNVKLLKKADKNEKPAEKAEKKEKTEKAEA